MPSPTDRIEKQVQLNAPLDRVWQALTDYKAVRRVVPRQPRGPVRSRRVLSRPDHPPGVRACDDGGEGRRDQTANVLLVLLASLRHRSAGRLLAEERTLVEFTLEPKNGGVLLQVVESGFDKIPAGRRDEAFRMNSGGWAAQLNNNIKAYVEK